MSKPDKTDGCGDDTKPTVGPLKLTAEELALLKPFVITVATAAPGTAVAVFVGPDPGLVLHVCTGSPGQVVADELLDVRRH